MNFVVDELKCLFKARLVVETSEGDEKMKVTVKMPVEITVKAVRISPVAPASEEEVARKVVFEFVFPLRRDGTGNHIDFKRKSFAALYGDKQADEVKSMFLETGGFIYSFDAKELTSLCLAAIHEVADPLRTENVALRERVKELEDSEDFMRQLQNAKLTIGDNVGADAATKEKQA